MKYDRVWEVVTHHTPFRKNIWIQLGVKIYYNYRKINCEYIESQNNTKLGMNLRRKSAEFCTHELHHTAVKVTKRKYFTLDAHFIGFSTFFVSAWMHTWKSLTGPLVCTFINTKPGPDLATADGERTSKFSHELHDIVVVMLHADISLWVHILLALKLFVKRVQDKIYWV